MSLYKTEQTLVKPGSEAGRRRDDRSGKARGEAAVPPVVREVLKSPGLPLDPATRAFMEPRFGHDFSKVRVHADDQASQSAEEVNALAYTAGSHVVFGSEGYRPESAGGKRLLAHELAHVVQQGQREGAAVRSVSPAASPQEAEAVEAASGVLSGRSLKATANIAGAGLDRQPAEPNQEKPATLPPPQQTATAQREREVGAVVVGKQTYVLYQNEVRTNGSSSWLAKNPGNLDLTPELVAWGAYEGKPLPWGQHRFAIFPEVDTGFQAVKKFLRAHQGERDIKLMMNMFAPAGDVDNDPDKYANQVAAALKVPVTTLVKTLNDGQIDTFAHEIWRIEGWQEGQYYSRDNPDLPPEVRNH